MNSVMRHIIYIYSVICKSIRAQKTQQKDSQTTESPVEEVYSLKILFENETS